MGSAGETKGGPGVTVRHEPEATRFVATVEGGEAVLAYAPVDERTLDLQHTVVPPEARGRRVADALVRAAVAHARQTGGRLVPSCPYVAAWTARHPETAGLFGAA